MRPYLDGPSLIAFSGGLDSMALFHMCLHLRKHFTWTFSVAHIHHGSAPGALGQYRDRARLLTKDLCREYQVPWYENEKPPSEPLFSEADFRDYRYAQLDRIRLSAGARTLVLGHHRDDQLETQLLQMIRGAGPQGAQGMTVMDGVRLRPLLSFHKMELEAYCQELGVVETANDPTNCDPSFLRNWLREVWLPQLEERRPGSLQSLSRSIELLGRTADVSGIINQAIQGNAILIEVFLTLSPADQSRVLATFFHQNGLKNYGKSHVNEVIKRLDTVKKKLTFNLLKRQWKLDAGRLKVQGLGEIEPEDV